MVMGVCIIGMVVLPVTCIRPCLQCLCHDVDIDHVDCGWDGVFFGSAGDGVASPHALFLGHVRQHQFAAALFDGLRAYRPRV